MLDLLPPFAAAVFAVWSLAVLFGAPIYSAGTAAFVALQAVLVAAPAALALRGQSPRSAAATVADPSAWPTRAPSLLISAGALVGAWAAAAVLHLDKPEWGAAWSAVWQRWPAASCVGAAAGAALGAMAAAAAAAASSPGDKARRRGV
jgi:branched-subunit amino acid ABC-type transport system permease component